MDDDDRRFVRNTVTLIDDINTSLSFVREILIDEEHLTNERIDRAYGLMLGSLGALLELNVYMKQKLLEEKDRE